MKSASTMKYLFLFLGLILYACNTDTNSAISSIAADEINYSPMVMPNCPSLEPSIDTANVDNSLLIAGTCSQAQSKDTLYFRKDGGFDCAFLSSSIPSPLKHNIYEDNEECKYILASYSYLNEQRNIISVQNDYCESNFCYESGIIYTDQSSAPVTKIECLWYSIAHTSNTSLLISVDKNDSGKERVMHLSLGYAGCNKIVTIIQLAE